MTFSHHQQETIGLSIYLVFCCNVVNRLSWVWRPIMPVSAEDIRGTNRRHCKRRRDSLGIALIILVCMVLIAVAWDSLHQRSVIKKIGNKGSAEENIGHLIIEAPGSCSELKFDNQTGQWEVDSSGRCDSIANDNGYNGDGGTGTGLSKSKRDSSANKRKQWAESTVVTLSHMIVSDGRRNH